MPHMTKDQMELLKSMQANRFPTYGYTQRELRFLYVDQGCRQMLSPDATKLLNLRNDGPKTRWRPDTSGFWLEEVSAA